VTSPQILSLALKTTVFSTGTASKEIKRYFIFLFFIFICHYNFIGLYMKQKPSRFVTIKIE
jgi:hypothetical protein